MVCSCKCRLWVRRCQTAVNSVRIVDLEPRRQPVDQEHAGVARLRLGHFQHGDEAIVLAHLLRLNTLELEYRRMIDVRFVP